MRPVPQMCTILLPAERVKERHHVCCLVPAQGSCQNATRNLDIVERADEAWRLQISRMLLISENRQRQPG